MADDASIHIRPPSPSQLKAARALPDNTKPDWPALHMTVPASEYIDDARYALEQERLFKRLPVALAPSAWLPEPGTNVCRDDYGLPIILTRDKSGEVHALMNVCRHRGSRLVRHQEVEAAKLFVCPYHAWSYDLSGKLAAVPREETFCEVDKGELGLAKLPCVEKGGIIWAILDHEAEADFSHLSDELIGDLTAVGLRDMHVYDHHRYDVAGNWKLVMDTFLEGYHVTRLHATTLGAVSEDVSVKVDRLGWHLRQTSGRINFRQQMVEDAAHSFEALRRAVVFVYTLVPNAVLICSTTFINLLIFEPSATGRTMVENFMLVNAPPETEEMKGKLDRMLHRTAEQAFPEDFSASAASHEGLMTGVNKQLILGGMEQAVKIYHDLINDLIEGRPLPVA